MVDLLKRRAQVQEKICFTEQLLMFITIVDQC